jgi:predicted neuraminidase
MPRILKKKSLAGIAAIPPLGIRVIASLVNELIFLFESKLLLHMLNNNNSFWLELSNAFDCVSQKENILLNTENKRILGVLTGFGLLNVGLVKFGFSECG